MTKEQLWNIYCERNPKFGDFPDTQITLTVQGLKKFFDQTWQAAIEEGKKLNVASKPKYDLPEGFEQLFGGFK